MLTFPRYIDKNGGNTRPNAYPGTVCWKIHPNPNTENDNRQYANGAKLRPNGQTEINSERTSSTYSETDHG